MNKRLRDVLIVGSIVILGLVLRLVFFSGIGISDDLFYARSANLIFDTFIDDVITLAVRLGLIYITAFSYALFGVSDLSSVLFVLLTSLGGIVLVYFFGKLFFNRKVGILSAFLMALFPFDIMYATRLLSDVPAGFFMSLGVFLFLYAEMKQVSNRILFCFGSGLLIGLGYFIRESALLIGLFFICYVLYKRRISFSYFFVPLGILLIVGIEMLLFLHLTGDPLFRLIQSQQGIVSINEHFNHFGRLDFPQGLFHYPYIIITNPMVAFYFIGFFGAIFYCIYHKRTKAYPLMLWFLSLLLYLSFGSVSITRYSPFRAVDRYFTVLIVPGIVLLGYFLSDSRKFFRRYVFPLILFVLVITSVAALFTDAARNITDTVEESYPYVIELDKPVYTDERTKWLYDYYSGFTDFSTIIYDEDISLRRDVYVVVNYGMLKDVRDAQGEDFIPKEVDTIPSFWQEIRRFGDGGREIVVYYASP